MKKQTIQMIQKEGIIAILRGSLERETLLRCVQALVTGGIALLELPFSYAHPETAEETVEQIQLLHREWGEALCLGAGTVVDPVGIQAVQAAGGRFILSPHLDAAVVEETNRLGLVSIPGAYTPTELVQARKLGGDFVKLFPVVTGGCPYLQSVLAPLEGLPIVAVGGVNVENCSDWIRAGATAVGVGGSLVRRQWILDHNWQALEDLARQFVNTIDQVRREKEK